MRRFAKAFGSTIGSRLTIAVANYALFWALTRHLDQEQVGGFSVVMSTFFVVQLLPLMGLSIPIIRRIATNPGDLASEATNAFGFSAPTALLIALAVGAWGQTAYEATLAIPIWLIALSLLPTSWIIVAETCLVGTERLPVIARLNMAESALRTVLALAAVWAGYGLVAVFTVFLVLRIAAAVFYLCHAGLPAPSVRHFSMALQRRNLAEVPVYCGIALAAAIMTRLDIFIVSSFRGLAETATYSAAARLYEAALMFPTVLSLVIMPVLARQFMASQARFRHILSLVVRCALVFGLGAALVAATLAQPVIDLLYRPELSGAASVLRWLTFAAALMLTDVILSSSMLAAKAQRHDLRALIIGLAVLVLALVPAVKRFGAEGAAAAVVLSLVVRTAVRIHWATRHFGMRSVWTDFIRTLCCAGIAFATLRASLNLGLFSSLGIALSCYAFAYVVSGGLGVRPLLHLRDMRAEFMSLGQR